MSTCCHLFSSLHPNVFIKLRIELWSLLSDFLNDQLPFWSPVHCPVCRRINLTRINGIKNLAYVNPHRKNREPYASTIELRSPFKGKNKRRGKFLLQKQWFEDAEDTNKEDELDRELTQFQLTMEYYYFDINDY